MGKPNKPIGALQNIGELKHILKHKSATKLYFAPGPGLDKNRVVKISFTKGTYLRNGILFQVNTDCLNYGNDRKLYLDKIYLGGRPLRVIDFVSNDCWPYFLVFNHPQLCFIFHNYYLAYGYMLRASNSSEEVKLHD